MVAPRKAGMERTPQRCVKGSIDCWKKAPFSMHGYHFGKLPISGQHPQRPPRRSSFKGKFKLAIKRDGFGDLPQIMQKAVMEKETEPKPPIFQASDIIGKSSSGPAVLFWMIPMKRIRFVCIEVSARLGIS
ncbi:uncharacterized protein ACIBXB_000174 [Morphnus guianensis]